MKRAYLIWILVPIAIAGCGGSSSSQQVPESFSNNNQIIHESTTPASDSDSFQANEAINNETKNNETENNETNNTVSVFSPGDSVAGEQAYIAAGCSGCHGNKGIGAASTGNSLGDNVLDLLNLQSAQIDETNLASYIQDEMPLGTASLCEHQCAADIAAYLLTWLENQNSELNQALSENLDGETLYQQHQCALCHGDRGEGSLSFGSQIVIENWGLSALSQKILHTMPVNDPTACGEACSAAIAEYMLTWMPENNCGSNDELLERRLRLLTPLEYQNTVNDLFDLGEWDIESRLPKTATVRGYDNNAQQTQVSHLHVMSYWELAESITVQIDSKNIVDCELLSGEACAQKLINTEGKRIFRRPLTDEEKFVYQDLFSSSENNDDGIRLVLKAMLMSPNFIYRSELGEADEVIYQLTSYEIASLLSYTFWGTMPDADLMLAADANALSSKAQIKVAAQRLVNDSRAQGQLIHFAEQWLGVSDISELTKDIEQYPDFNAMIAEAMERELYSFLGDSFLNNLTTFGELFSANYSFLDSILADYYGIEGVNGGSQRVEVGIERGGLLKMGALLSSHAKEDQSSPIARGVFVRERLLCQSFPAPPENVGEIEPLDPNKSTRERFSQHTDNDGCRSCHEKIDPIGFSFERYDGAGGYREFEGNGLLVDDTGFITGLERMSDTDHHAYEGVDGLAQIIADSDHAASCMVEQFHRYMQGVEQPNQCTIDTVAEQWAQGGYTLTELWIESVLTDSFTKRR